MADPRRILIFQTAYLGDLVLATPLIDASQALFPGAAIDLVTLPAWAPLVEHHPTLRQVITFDKRGADRGLGGTRRLARRLRGEQYDLALCPHPSFRSALALRIAGIPERVGFHDSAGAFLWTRKVRRDHAAHEVVRVLSLLEPFGGGEGAPAAPRVALDPKLDIASLKKRISIGASEKLVGLHPGSAWATKRWPAQRFGELARALRSEFDRVLVFGTASEGPIVDEVLRYADERTVGLAGALSLSEFAAIISQLSAFVTNDSGPMHVAASFGVPVVAIFGSTVPAFGYGPFGTRHRVVEQGLYCRPCGPHGRTACPEKHFRCMLDTDVAAVSAALDALLAGH
ncbi:MAG: lipopolysaccharide heptosyltransferase II [Deltaproteobacteria bacterium]|nr:lipopolysaccharide heptosyltransferase II [Deltaproteobacteria bacterium]